MVDPECGTAAIAVGEMSAVAWASALWARRRWEMMTDFPVPAPPVRKTRGGEGGVFGHWSGCRAFSMSVYAADWRRVRAGRGGAAACDFLISASMSLIDGRAVESVESVESEERMHGIGCDVGSTEY